jgi:hypothetical protein
VSAPLDTRHARATSLAAIVALACGAQLAFAHHEITAKFDETKPQTLNGVVTGIDWRNPHAHVFVNVTSNGAVENWAVELESTIALEKSGWRSTTLQAGDAITVSGIVARDGTRQIWGDTLTDSASGRKVLYAVDTAPIAPKSPRPTPRGADGKPIFGSVDTESGYWGYPTATALQQQGSNAPMSAHGLLENLADAPKVAPFQPWALGLYRHRQQRQLRDDPAYLNCKPPGR